MFAGSRSSAGDGARLLAVASLALVPLSACSGGGGGGPGDTTAPAVSATPATSTFSTGSIEVALAATDAGDSAPAIYYTTDATIPTTASAAYAGPVTVDRTMVVRFFAVDASGNVSAVALEGYTQALNPIAVEWAASGHGDIVSEPFRHWDADGEVSTSCARCHTGEGFADLLEDNAVDAAAPLPLGHHCETCHTAPPFTLYDDLSSYPLLEPIEFPSLETASMWGHANMCASCHQGRSSTEQVDEAILADPDGPYSFVNIHYYAAAASYFGAETRGGYQYEGLEYAGRNPFSSHPADKTDCVGCHMRGEERDHHFVPVLADCTECHAGDSFETLAGSPAANHDAIELLEEQLLAEIGLYAASELGTPIVYDALTYPYFFVDLDGDGVADAEELEFGNRFSEFDDALLRAAYNYQVSVKEPAGFVHNGTYLRQLLHDSIADLGGEPAVVPPGRPGFEHEDASKADQWHVSGHADSLGEPFRHWDEDGEISTSCAKCHAPAGFVDYVADGTVDAAPLPGGLVGCAACHAQYDLFTDASTRYDDLAANPALEPVEFPSGATQSMGGPSNLCMTCHQGRESGLSIDAAPPNTAVQAPVDYDSFDFINRHYYAAAAILFGSDVTAGYEYAGKSYLGQNVYAVPHNDKVSCVGCHMRDAEDHGFLPQLDDCTTCHWDLEDFEELGLAFGSANLDYDGDGTGESFQREIDGAAASLYAAIQDYAENGLPQSSKIVYAPGSYPYWFEDSDGNGALTPGEEDFGNRYRDFDRELLRAAYNYHSAQDPCGDMHNYRYVLQSLYDSTDALDNGALDGSAPGTRP